MKTSLKQATKEHFAKQTMSDTQLQQLQLKLKSTQDHCLRDWMGIAAMFTLLVLAVFHFYPTQPEPGLAIAQEVAKNHIKLRPLEVISDDFNKTSAYFQQLDFVLAPSRRIDQPGLTLLGGRYCSIQSETAAQLRYIDSNGKPLTLYQVGFDAGIFGYFPDIGKGQEPRLYYVDGLRVLLWVEKGLLMASVKSD